MSADALIVSLKRAKELHASAAHQAEHFLQQRLTLEQIAEHAAKSEMLLIESAQWLPRFIKVLEKSAPPGDPTFKPVIDQINKLIADIREQVK